MKDYYQILGLEKSATQEEIKAAFRLYASKFHPDKQKGDKLFASNMLNQINKAVEDYSNVTSPT